MSERKQKNSLKKRLSVSNSRKTRENTKNGRESKKKKYLVERRIMSELLGRKRNMKQRVIRNKVRSQSDPHQQLNLQQQLYPHQQLNPQQRHMVRRSGGRQRRQRPRSSVRRKPNTRQLVIRRSARATSMVVYSVRLKVRNTDVSYYGIVSRS